MLLIVVFKQSQIANGTNISLRIKNKRAESMDEDAHNREHQQKKVLSGRRDRSGFGGRKEDAFSRNREQYDERYYLSVYVLQASSMQLHTFMLGIDVVRRAFLLIFTPPFPTGGMGKHAPKTIICTLYRMMIPYGKRLVNCFCMYICVQSRQPPERNMPYPRIIQTQHRRKRICNT